MNNFYIDCIIKERRQLEAEECRKAQLLKSANSDFPGWHMRFSRLLEKVINFWNTKIVNNVEKKGCIS